MSNDIYDVVIVGGGAAGLSALSTLKSTRNLLLESSPKLGGRVETIEFGPVTAELGAFYPLTSNTDISPLSCDEGIKPFLFIQSTTNAKEYKNFKHAFNCLIDKDKPSLSDLFSQRFLLNNSELNLRLNNTRYGDLTLLSKEQYMLVQALHQITHPGDIKDFPSMLRPLCLVSEPNIHRVRTNTTALLNYFPVPPGSDVYVNSKVINIREVDDCVEVRYTSGSKMHTVKSKSLILTPPPPSCFHTLETINEESLRFYQASPYLGGWSFVLYYQGEVPSQSILVSTNYDWSVCFITKTDENHYLVNCYVPATRIDSSDEMSLLNYILSTLSCHLPDGATLLNSHSKYWRYLAPHITEATIENYTTSHFRLGDRVFYAGELSTFSLRNMYTYGVPNAIRAGNLIAQLVLKELTTEGSAHLRSSLPPLLTAFIYKNDFERPTYIGSQQEGNVAFYGLVLSASGSNTLKNYLLQNSVNGMWEYHMGFGVTLEDTLLVLEGLIDNGLKEQKLQYHLNQCIHNFYDQKTGLFNTLSTGRDRYWEGSSIHGTVHAYYLIFQHHKDPSTLITINDLVDYVLEEFSPKHVWNSRWFCNPYFTSFYVIRLLCLFPSNVIARRLIDAHAEQILQSQLHDGSWNNQIISTASIVLTLSSIVSNQIFESNKQIKHSIKLGCGFLQSKLHKKEYLNEPILYYWFDTSSSDTKHSKRFYHCVDNGQISHSLITMALRSADNVLSGISKSS